MKDLSKNQYKAAVAILLGVIILMASAGLVAFFLSLRGEEQTMVPELRGLELTAALIKLQDKELYPRIFLRFSESSSDKDKVLEQKPLPGAIVKAGRRIQLTVSRGAVVDKVENYVGQELNEVKIHLQTLFASSSRPLITIRDPPLYRFDKSPAGTILEQKPLPDTPISVPVALDLVISRGPERPQAKAPALEGQAFTAALKVLETASVPFSFAMRKAAGKEKAGVVVSQTPAAGATVPTGQRLQVVVTEPAPQKDVVSGVVSTELPVYPYPLRLNLDAILPTGERQRLFTVKHAGGAFSAPYSLPSGSVIVLSVLDREAFRLEVRSE